MFLPLGPTISCKGVGLRQRQERDLEEGLEPAAPEEIRPAAREQAVLPSSHMGPDRDIQPGGGAGERAPATRVEY